jgi:hypothetical protein
MPARALIRSFVVLWWVLGVSLLVLSVRTLLSALHEGGGHGVHLAVLAGIEATAALLFLLPRTLRLGAAGLLFAITIAWLAHLHDQFRWDLMVYAAAVLFVAVHGPLTTEQWRRALPG